MKLQIKSIMKSMFYFIKENKEVFGISSVVVFALVFFLSAYTVDETEQVVITQFGKVVGKPKVEAGLYFRVPVIQHINKFPKNLQEWDGDQGQIPTLDKTYIWVDTFARWLIVEPIKFFQTVNNATSAIERLDDIIDPAVRNFITSYPLIETVRQTNRKMDTFEMGMDESNERHIGTIKVGRERITEGILKQAKPKLREFGIELVDVKIKRVNYVEQVRESVYGRMIAERKQIAEKFRSEGQGEARKILGKKERELKRISSEAYKTAQEIMGQADAEAISIYANAYEKDPDFYSFIQTLENYSTTINKETSLILSTDAEYLKFFKGYSLK